MHTSPTDAIEASHSGTAPAAPRGGSATAVTGAVDARKTDEVPDASGSDVLAPATAEGPAESGQGAPGTDSDADAWADYDDRAYDGWAPLTVEGEAQATADYDQVPTDGRARQPAVQAAPGARLVALGGDHPGTEYPFDNQDVLVGRGASSGLVIADPSVSREHARLLRDGDHFVLVDNRSANGVFVNGARVDRARLSSGDEVAFGSVVFRFLEGNDVWAPDGGAEADSVDRVDAVGQGGRRKPRWLAATVGLALFAAGAAGAGLVWWRSRPAQPPQRNEQLLAQFQSGVEAFKARRWDEAEQRFRDIVAADGQHAAARQYLDAIGGERVAEARLGRARRQLAAGRLAKAFASATALLTTSFHDEAASLLLEIESALSKHVDEARSALTRGEGARAQSLLTEVEGVRPDWPELASLKARASALTEVRGPARDPSSPTRSKPGHGAKGASPGQGRVVFRGPADVRPVLEALSRGEVDAALDAVGQVQDRARAEAMSGQLSKIKELLEVGDRQYRAKRAAGALEMFAQALEEATAMGVTRGTWVVDVNRRMADMDYVQGIESYIAGDYPAAFLAFQHGVQRSPGHDRCQRKLEELERRGGELLGEAEQLAQADPGLARSRVELVLQIVGEDSEIFRKAKQVLRALP